VLTFARAATALTLKPDIGISVSISAAAMSIRLLVSSVG